MHARGSVLVQQLQNNRCTALFKTYTNSSLVTIMYVVKDILCDVKSMAWLSLLMHSAALVLLLFCFKLHVLLTALLVHGE